MPPFLSVEQLKRHRWKAKDKEGVFFIPTLYHKQGIVMLDAVHLAQKEWDFTLFASGLKKYKEYADAINVRYYDLGVLPRDDYLEWLASTKLSLSVSSSEDFAYIAAESLAMGVPCIVSPVVAKNMGIAEEKLVVKDISSAEEISSRISRVLALGDESYRKLCEKCASAIKQTSERNNKSVKETFINIQN